MTLTEICDYLALFSNDVKILHWYASGKGFLSNHDELDGLYGDLTYWMDKVSEMAISHGEYPMNPTYAGVRVTDWTPLDVENYNTDKLLPVVIQKGNVVLNAFETLDDIYSSFVYSEIDTMSAELDKTINYKFTRVMTEKRKH